MMKRVMVQLKRLGLDAKPTTSFTNQLNQFVTLVHVPEKGKVTMCKCYRRVDPCEDLQESLGSGMTFIGLKNTLMITNFPSAIGTKIQKWIEANCTAFDQFKQYKYGATPSQFAKIAKGKFTKK
jgi:hypothetical protein